MLNTMLTQILSSDPSSITDAQLVDLYACIVHEMWDAKPAKRAPKDHLLYVVWFCRHSPAILSIVGDVQKHLKDEFSWVDHAQLMQSAVSRDKENLPLWKSA